MKKIEKGLYKDILKNINFEKYFIENYLNGTLIKEISEVKELGIDESYKILFGNKDITPEEKEAFKNMLLCSMETLASSILRLFESDLYEIDGYEPPVNLDAFGEKNPEWSGSLLMLTDLKGDFITDDSLYENFLEYVEKRKSL